MTEKKTPHEIAEEIFNKYHLTIPALLDIEKAIAAEREELDDLKRGLAALVAVFEEYDIENESLKLENERMRAVVETMKRIEQLLGIEIVNTENNGLPKDQSYDWIMDTAKRAFILCRESIDQLQKDSVEK